MSSYIIDVTNTSGEEGTVIADVGFSYSDNLNDINNAQLKISGTGVAKRSLFEIGSIVKIQRNNNLEFHGIINGISYLDGGGISADLLGFESWLAKENGAFAGSPWSSTASATIASAVIGESNYFTAGTVQAGASIDFRSEATDSLYNALQRLIKRVGQDIGIDYPNSEVDILDHKGSSSSVMTLNDGIQLRDMVVRQSYPIGNDVRVYGKSEGETRIKSNNASYGQDASSKSTYGIIRKDYIDNSVVTQAEANAVADVLVAQWKDPVKIYEFDVMNPNQNLVSGDVITLNSSTKGLAAEEVRIVSIKRGVDGSNEFLTLEVTNKEYSRMTKSVNQKIAELENQSKNLQTYDGYQEEYSNQVNTTTSIGGVIDVYPSYLDLNSYSLGNVNAVEGDDSLNLWSKQNEDVNIYPWDGECNIFNPLNMQGDKVYNMGTNYWSCSGVNFKGWRHGDQPTEDYHYTYGRLEADEDTVTLFCPVFLPHGAVVTAVTVYGSISDEQWELGRMDLGATTWATMAGGNFNSEDTSISNATIDNSAYSYTIFTSGIDDGDMIYGVRITYTL